jgi:hypothetical protein
MCTNKYSLYLLSCPLIEVKADEIIPVGIAIKPSPIISRTKVKIRPPTVIG